MENLSGAYLIAGCGVSGWAAARFAAESGLNYALADERAVSLPDEPLFRANPPSCIYANWTPGTEFESRFTCTVISPGIRMNTAFYKALAAVSDHIVSELQFASSRCPQCPLLCITGTNGKTTVTELTTLLFQALGEKAQASGNIGAGLSDGIRAYQQGTVSRLIVEVSTFQLEHTDFLNSNHCAILNLASDHIDRHGSFEEYARLKFHLASLTSGKIVLNYNLLDMAEKYHLDSNRIITFSHDNVNADFHMVGNLITFHDQAIVDYSGLPLQGPHNAENVMAALALVYAVHGETVLKSTDWSVSLKKFRLSAHRQEVFLEKNGVTYIDDSKATNPHAVIAALQRFQGGRNIRLLLGGLDKAMDFTEMADSLQYVKKIYLTGKCRDVIAADLRKIRGLQQPCETVSVEDFEETVRLMCREAQPGDVVMLSPATASFDHFKSYAHRGDVFQACVKAAVL